MRILRPDNELPLDLKTAVSQASANHESSSEFREAMAYLQAKNAYLLYKATRNLYIATWVLAFSTIALCVITFSA